MREDMGIRLDMITLYSFFFNIRCMNIEQTLLNDHSKPTAESIADYVIDNPKAIAELMDCFFHKELRLCQRASWSVSKLADKQASLLLPFMRKMISNLDHPLHDAVVRNTIRVWGFMPIDEEYEGEIFERCFNYIVETKHAVAIRAFAITVAGKIALKYPELKHELREEMLNQQIYAEKAAIKYRLRKWIKKLT